MNKTGELEVGQPKKDARKSMLVVGCGHGSSCGYHHPRKDAFTVDYQALGKTPDLLYDVRNPARDYPTLKDQKFSAIVLENLNTVLHKTAIENLKDLLDESGIIIIEGFAQYELLKEYNIMYYDSPEVGNVAILCDPNAKNPQDVLDNKAVKQYLVSCKVNANNMTLKTLKKDDNADYLSRFSDKQNDSKTGLNNHPKAIPKTQVNAGKAFQHLENYASIGEKYACMNAIGNGERQRFTYQDLHTLTKSYSPGWGRKYLLGGQTKGIFQLMKIVNKFSEAGGLDKEISTDHRNELYTIIDERRQRLNISHNPTRSKYGGTTAVFNQVAAKLLESDHEVMHQYADTKTMTM